jgi:8-oxo-dGTP pyrophosphatase MutT (NUDIX family)
MPLPLFRLPPDDQRNWLMQALARPAPLSARNLSDGFRLPGREGTPTPAAVLVPLVNRPEGLQILLTQRSAELPDHPGQISFPGGRVEPGDTSSAAAALREATEESAALRSRRHPGSAGGLRNRDRLPGDPGRRLGRAAVRACARSVEVADVFEVPLAFVLDPANQQRHFRMLGALRRDFWAIPYENRYIWGRRRRCC